MKIYAISVIKNEADIIEYSLTLASQWADKVIVYDNGSTDGTWEKVKALTLPNIIPYKQSNRPYSDGLRAEIFNAFKHELNEGDWWVIQDSDEIYEDNPRDFILNNKGYYHHINGKKVDFCFNLNNIDSIDFHQYFENNLKHFIYFTPEAWSEPRLIRHRKRLKWEEKKIWPKAMGLVCTKAINIKHYPLRSEEQIKKRWTTRKKSKKQGGQHFDHWDKDDWQDYYEQKLKTLQQVKKEESIFDLVRFANNYNQSFLKRVVKTILHRTGVLP